MVPLKIWHLWSKDGEAEWAFQAGYAQYDQNWYLFRFVRWVNQIYYTLLVAGLLLSVIFVRKRTHEVAWPWILFGYVFVVYLTVISIVFSGQPRFHFPTMLWIIMYAAWVVDILWIQDRPEVSRRDEGPAFRGPETGPQIRSKTILTFD